MINKVGIITLNYNQSLHTLECINSVLDSTFQDFAFYVIDNGSGADEYKILEENLPSDSRIKLHKIDDNVGYVGGINHGLEIIRNHNHPLTLILNNDIFVDKNALTELMETHSRYENVIVSGKVYHYNEKNKIQDIGQRITDARYLRRVRIGLNEIDTGQFDEELERDMLDDVFWLFPTDLYDQIGGYSTHFWFNSEQADFALRAKKAGYKLMYTPKAMIWHKGSATIGGRSLNPRQAYWTVQSSLILRYLHLERKYFFIYYLRTLRGVFGTLLKSILIKRDKDHLMYAYGKWSGLMYFNRWILKKNKNTGKIPRRLSV